MVVDLGCGAGDLLAALPKRFEKHGIDISPAMLELARKAVPDASFTLGSATTASLPRCDAVTAIGEVFSFAAAQDGRAAVAAAFRRIHGALRPGGVFLLDVASPGRAPKPTSAKRHGDGWRVEASAREDGDTLVRTIDAWWTTPGGERHSQEVHQLALLDEAWVLEHLRAAGFTVEAMGAYDDYALQIGWDAYCATRIAG